MKELENLLEKNRKWASQKLAENPRFFTDQIKPQKPKYLWIGCSDSRVTPTEILGLSQGDLFVHRNIGNLVPHNDVNSLSVLQYAVHSLNIESVIVCGHYNCGAVLASMERKPLGIIDTWIQTIRDVYNKNKEEILSLPEGEPRMRRLVELNVYQQVKNICHTTIIQNAWSAGKKLAVHGWVYDISSGNLSDLDCSIFSVKQIEKIYRKL